MENRKNIQKNSRKRFKRTKYKTGAGFERTSLESVEREVNQGC